MDDTLKGAIISAAQEAGFFLRRQASSRKTAYDMEKRARDLMVRTIRAADPSVSLWGEAQEGARAVSICPLDSPVNFSRGFGEFGVMAAIIEEGSPVFAVISLPERGSMVTAERGRGARADGRKLSASRRDDIRASLVCCYCDMYSDGEYAPGIEAIGALSRNGIAWRNTGSPAADYAAVAAGAIDGVVVPLHEASHAAGFLVMQEAGAVVTDLEGKPFSVFSAGVVAAGPNLHQGILEVVTSPFR
ncbi:MAG: inositol monophosphatase family protein [Candidatus Micrarchaeia archaeon]